MFRGPRVTETQERPPARTVAVLMLYHLGQNLVREIRGYRRAILGVFPTNESSKWYNICQGYGSAALLLLQIQPAVHYNAAVYRSGASY
jgi:hypothetical protein